MKAYMSRVETGTTGDRQASRFCMKLDSRQLEEEGVYWDPEAARG